MDRVEQLFDQINTRTGQILIICAISLFSTQLMKFIFMSIRHKKPVWFALWTTGGMPSSHSSTVVSLVTSLGVFQLYDSQRFDYSFAVAIVFAIIVLHDSMGVRLEASKHAIILNKVVENEPSEIRKELGFGKKGQLKELLGHKPVEVLMGCFYGVFVACIGCFIIIKLWH